MGFFFKEQKKAKTAKRHIPIQTMNEIGCKACPLHPKEKDLKHPKMDAAGSSRPLVYILGDRPSRNEDIDGEPFSVNSSSGEFIRHYIPQYLDKYIRYHNLIKCHAKELKIAEIECCRNFIVNDIEQTKPLIVVGCGNEPLTWATGMSGGTFTWRGQLIATKIGTHNCWYLPVYDPVFVIEKIKGFRGKQSEFELAFKHDFLYLEDLLNSDLEPPEIFEVPYDTGIISIDGSHHSHFNLLEDLLNEFVKLDKVAIDLETINLRPYFAKSTILTCAIGTFDKTVAFAIDHPFNGWSNAQRKKVWGMLGEFIRESGTKIAHNLAFEMEWLSYYYGSRILTLTNWADTQAQTHTLNEAKGTNSLDDNIRQYLGFFLKDQSNVDSGRILEFPLPDVLRYNGMDTKWTYKLFEHLEPMILSEPKYRYEYERKIRLAPTLIKTQLKGLDVDLDMAESLNNEAIKTIKNLTESIQNTNEVKEFKSKFGEFVPSSSDHVIKLMRDICKRTEVNKGDNSFSSGEDVLSKLPKEEVPSASMILEYRTITKIKSTYIDPIIYKRILGIDGLVHPQLASMVAVTGRLAAFDPNLQNWPKRQFKEIRKIIKALEGYYLVPIDYGQIEARVVAMATEDENLVKYLWTGYDIHMDWAKRIIKAYPKVQDYLHSVFDLPDYKAVLKTMRGEVKNGWVFPQFFGASHYSCARSLHIPEDIAEDLANEFWDEFKGVKKWQTKLLKSYEKNLYVETLTGRKRRGAMTKEQIVNHPIQGTAADIVTESMTELSILATIEENEEYQPNLNVHDDLTFNLLKSELDNRLEVITSIMCKHRFDFINVPLIIEVSIGSNWYNAKEYKIFHSNELFNLKNPYKENG